MSAHDLMAGVRDLLNRRRMKFLVVKDFANAGDPTVQLLVPAERLGQKAVRGSLTSLRQLSFLRSSVRRSLGVDLTWVIQPILASHELEANLLNLVNSRFPGVFSDVIVSSPSVDPRYVWYVAELSGSVVPDIDELSNFTKKYFEAQGYPAPSVGIEDGRLQLSDGAILKALKSIAPAVAQDILVKIEQVLEVKLPSIEWLEKRLDALRRKGFLVWLGSNSFALSRSGLAAVPHGRNRTSSDIERALALGRRRW